MAEDKTSMFCESCDSQVLAVRPGTNHVLHLLLSIVTGGLWIIVWILLSVRVGGWRCSRCGRLVTRHGPPSVQRLESYAARLRNSSDDRSSGPGIV